MLINAIAFLVVASTSTVFASPAPTRTVVNRANSVLQGRDFSLLAAGANTNAKRLALGLPLLPPKFKREPTGPKPSNTPHMPKPGNIHVTKRDTGEEIGYIGRNLPGGLFGVVPGEPEDQVLEVSIDVGPAIDGQGLRKITLVNSVPGDFPYLGCIGNRPGELGPDNDNTVELGATVSSDANDPPAVKPNSFTDATQVEQVIESDIFKIDAKGVISVHWVNPDSSKPDYFLVYTPENLLQLTGDMSGSNLTQVILTFVPLFKR